MPSLTLDLDPALQDRLRRVAERTAEHEVLDQASKLRGRATDG